MKFTQVESKSIETDLDNGLDFMFKDRLFNITFDIDNCPKDYLEYLFLERYNSMDIPYSFIHHFDITSKIIDSLNETSDDYVMENFIDKFIESEDNLKLIKDLMKEFKQEDYKEPDEDDVVEWATEATMPKKFVYDVISDEDIDVSDDMYKYYLQIILYSLLLEVYFNNMDSFFVFPDGDDRRNILIKFVNDLTVDEKTYILCHLTDLCEKVDNFKDCSIIVSKKYIDVSEKFYDYEIFVYSHFKDVKNVKDDVIYPICDIVEELDDNSKIKDMVIYELESVDDIEDDKTFYTCLFGYKYHKDIPKGKHNKTQHKVKYKKSY